MATARPVALASSPLQDLGFVRVDEGGEEDALALALLLADEDARCSDYGQALHALDAARALTGGVLPDAYVAKQREWLTRL